MIAGMQCGGELFCADDDVDISNSTFCCRFEISAAALLNDLLLCYSFAGTELVGP